LQQQAQEGLLGPVDPPGDHPLEVDRVVERDLLDSNGEQNILSLLCLSCSIANALYGSVFRGASLARGWAWQ
jgi:hypothetical protein